MTNEEYLKQLADAQKQQKQVELEQQKAAALKSIEEEQAKTMPTYTTQKQQTNVQSQLGAKNLAEFWANRGQTQAGISQQAELSRQNTLAGQLGQIGANEQVALQNFASQKGATETAYQSGLSSASNEINTNLATNLYNERLRQQDLAEKERIRLANIRAERATAKYKADLADKTGTINKLEGVTIQFKPGTKGVMSADGKKMVYSIPQSDGSVTQVSHKIGVNPFTGTENKDIYQTNKVTGEKELSTFENGYQPDNIRGTKLTGAKINGQQVKGMINGQLQNIHQITKTTDGGFLKSGKTTTEYYYWDDLSNKYITLNQDEKKAFGLK